MPEHDREGVEVVRQLLESVQAGAPERALELLHEDVRFDATVRPDGRLWHGREGARQAMAEWVQEWDEYELRFERYLQAGDGRVAVLWHEHGRARGSGVSIAQSGVSVFELRDGLVSEIRPRLDRERALAELGLTDV
jgi:ketosteroid isomerase-like protein